MTLQHPHADLSAYIDRALAPAAQAAVAEHVAACAVCRAHVAELRSTVSLLQALPDPVPSRRLVPRLAGPAWLAPLRTVMTLASGTAVFLFIASSLVNNITFLASGSAAAPAARDASGETTNFQAQGPTASQGAPNERSVGASAPSQSPAAALAHNPTTPPVAGAADAASSPGVDDAQKRSVQSTAQPAAPGAGAPLEARSQSSEPARSPLLNPWLWLSLALFTGAIAIALQRRLRRSV